VFGQTLFSHFCLPKSVSCLLRAHGPCRFARQTCPSPRVTGAEAWPEAPDTGTRPGEGRAGRETTEQERARSGGPAHEGG